MKRRGWIAIAAVVAIAGLLGAAVLLTGSNDKPEGLTVVGDSTEITEAEGSDTSLLDRFSRAASPIYSVHGEGDGPYELRFDIPPDYSGDPSRLVAASSAGEGEMWALHEGQVVGGRLIISSDHLSEWQLRILGVEIRIPSKSSIERSLGARATAPTCGEEAFGFELQVRDSSRTLLGPCVEFDGRPWLRVANNRAASLSFDAPDDSHVRLSGPSLSERSYDLLYQALPGDPLRLIPGAGAARISIPEVPTEIRFRVDSDAAILDLALALVTRGKSQTIGARSLEAAKCVQAAYGDGNERSVETQKDLLDGVASLIGECGETIGSELGLQSLADIGFALGVPRLGYGIWDAGRSIADAEATIRVGTLPEGMSALAITPYVIAKAGKSCGTFEGFYPDYGVGVLLELGVTGGTVACGEIENAIRNYVDATGPCDSRGAGTCWRTNGRWRCVAPTYSLYPIAVTCEDEERDERVLGLSGLVIAPDFERDCGTAPGAEPPGPYDVSANFDCEAAQRIANASMGAEPQAPPLYPFVCEVEPLSYESSTHTCRFKDSRVSFLSGA